MPKKTKTETVIEPVKDEADTKPKAPLGRPTKYEPSWMLPTLIKVGKAGGSNAEMALELGIHKDTFYDWIKKFPDFSDAVKLAELEAQIWWEKKGRMGATGEIQGFNSTAFIFQVKNRFREDYRDVHRAEVTGKDGGPIQTEAVVVDSSQLTPEHRAALRAALEATMDEDDED